MPLTNGDAMADTDDSARKLALISRASEALTEAKTIPDVRHLIGMAKAAEAYAREVKASQQVVDQAIELRIRAERRLGEMLKAMPGHEGTRGQLRGDVPKGGRVLASHPWKTTKELSDTVPDHHLRARSQRLASIPEDEFEETVAQAKAEGDLSVSRVLTKPHVAHNSGENEWYTPPEIIDAARSVLGEIDLDPASSETANKCVGAAKIFTAENSGLEKPWAGRVWMNPPYAAALVGKFCARLLEHVKSGAVTDAIVLVNNATETVWGQALLESCSAVCFPASRVKFLTAIGEKGAPLQGQMITYHGKNPAAFASAFSAVGVVFNA